MMYYNIHNMISIVVDPEVSSLVVESIDHQIEYFKCKKIINNSYQIIVKPYDSFVSSTINSQTFLLIRNREKYLVYPQNQLAYTKLESGYVIYANRPNFSITFLIQYLLSKLGLTMIHASGAVDKKGNVTLFSSAEGGGKTTILMYLVRNHNYCLVGDDLVILSEDGKCWSFPRYVGIKDFYEVSNIPGVAKPSVRKRLIFKTKKFLIKNAPFVGMFERFLYDKGLIGKVVRKLSVQKHLEDVPITKFYGEDTIVDVGSLKQIICLQKYSGELTLKPLSKESLCQFMISNTYSSWIKSFEPLFGLSAIGLENLTYYFNHVEEIIHSAIGEKEGWLLLIPDRINPKEIYKVLEENGLMEEQNCT